VNAHYGRQASALFYMHLTARQAPFSTVAIPPVGEAAYVIDGLLYHEADLSIATHHTDGGGVRDHVTWSGTPGRGSNHSNGSNYREPLNIACLRNPRLRAEDGFLALTA
jgi:hypothetical protein